MLDAPALRYGVPIFARLAPPEYHHWLPVAVRTIIKTVTILIAWYMQIIIASVQSAMRGGLMCSKAVLRIARNRGFISQEQADGLDGVKLAEIAGYSLAFAGFYCQWQWSFHPPFPLNIFLAPFTLVEWYIRWAISSPDYTAM